MIGFEDFVPRPTEAAGFLTAAKYESLRQTLDEANAWIEEHSVDVAHIETVVLPNIHAPYEEGSEDVSLHTSGCVLMVVVRSFFLKSR